MATPASCGRKADASLEFHPDEINLKGDGTPSATITLKNDGHASAAQAVLLGLRVTDGTSFLDRVEFGNGQVWQISGGTTSTLYLAGSIPAGGSASIPFTVYMRPAWLQAHHGAGASIRVEVASADCLKKRSNARLTIDLERKADGHHDDDGHHGAALVPGASAAQTVTTTPTVSDAPAPTPSVTPSPATTPTLTFTPTPPATPQPTATPTETPEPTATATPTAVPETTPIATSTEDAEPTETATPTDTPAPTPTASATSTPSVTPTVTSFPQPSG